MASRTKVVVQPLGFEAPVAKAADELVRYLPRMANVSVAALLPLGSLPRQSRAQIVLGTSAHLRGLGLGRLPEANEVDDALAIIPRQGVLYLTGSNPRSVLFAAYRLLEEMGAVFLRPGPGGEALPKRARLALPTKPIRESASYRYRGICIEGYPRMEHVLETLEWMAKKKMNSFQIQFVHGGAFWRRGYTKSVEIDAETRARDLSLEDYLAIDGRVVAKMDELGMVLHKVGHGWTANVLGAPGMSWRERLDHPLSAKKRRWCAEVVGKRGLFRGEPTNTELCYSNPEVREAFYEQVLRYARQHSEVDYLQVWLSDATNNKCECAACRRRSPTDWYMMLIEELGERSKAEGLATKIVCIAYQELIFPPDRKRVLPDNVTLMYAPMGRCYRHAFTDERCVGHYNLKRPKLNQFAQVHGNRAAAALARSWKGVVGDNSFLFDYYGWAAMWRDGLGMDMGDNVAEDMRDLDDLGLNGHLSCQCIRAFYPLPYWPNAMGDVLWNKRLPLAAHKRKVMAAAFGKHVRDVEKYFSEIVRAFRAGDTYRHETILDNPTAHGDRLAKAAALAARARRKFTTAAKQERDPVLRTSLELIALHAEHANTIAEAYLAGLSGDATKVKRLRAGYEKRLSEFLGRYSLWVDPMIADPVLQASARALPVAYLSRSSSPQAEKSHSRQRRNGEHPNPTRSNIGSGTTLRGRPRKGVRNGV
jgi:hypothetical protein